MNGKVREFREKDAPMLAEIFREAFTDEMSRGMQPIKAEQIVEHSKREGARIFVFESDKSEAVAFLMMFEGSIEYPAQVHMVAVKSDFRGKGMGKMLIQKALFHAKAIGRRKVKLFTRPWNTAMQKVCVELGFVPEAYLRRDYLNEDIIMYSAFIE